MRGNTIYTILTVSALFVIILSCASTKKSYIIIKENSCTGILPDPALLVKENVDLNMLNLAIKEFSIGNFNISRNNIYKPLLDKDSLAFWVKKEIVCNAAKVFKKASDKKWYYAMMQVSEKNSPKEFLEWLKNNPPSDYHLEKQSNQEIEKELTGNDDSDILKGNECYHYGDNETVSFAKKESKIKALIEAVESKGTFFESRITLKNSELIENIAEKLSSGYIKILKSEYVIVGRNVCCEIEISIEEAQKIFENKPTKKISKALAISNEVFISEMEEENIQVKQKEAFLKKRKYSSIKKESLFCLNPKNKYIIVNKTGKGNNNFSAYLAAQVLIDESFVRKYVSAWLVSKLKLTNGECSQIIEENLKGWVPPIIYQPENEAYYYKDHYEDILCANVCGKIDRTEFSSWIKNRSAFINDY